MHSQPIIGAIWNANAGLGTSREGLGGTVAAILTTPDLIYGTRTRADIRAAARALILRGITMLVVCGGDGTLKLTLEVYTEVMAEMGVTDMPIVLNEPLGTVRVVSSNVPNTRIDPRELARMIADMLHRGVAPSTVAINPIMANGKPCFVWGTAFLTNILNAYYRKKRRGLAGVTGVIGDALLDETVAALQWRPSKKILTRPVRARITLPGHDPAECPHREHTILLCSAVPLTGYGCRGAPDAMTVPGTFMLRSSKLGFWGYAANAVPLYLGVRELPLTFNALVSEAIIEFDHDTEATADGEMLLPIRRYHLKSGPPIRFVTGLV